MTLIARGESAVLHGGEYARRVVIKDFRYTPEGLRYELEPESAGTRLFAPAGAVSPFDGDTRLVRYNVMTGDEQALEASEPPRPRGDADAARSSAP